MLEVSLYWRAAIHHAEFGDFEARDFAAYIPLSARDGSNTQPLIDELVERLPEGPLKLIGDYQIELGLHTDVAAHITVSVLGEH